MLCLLLGAAARVAACFNDLWMDEVWTHELVAGIDSPLDVFTSIHSWNNHHLNTLVFYLLGPDVPEALYRLPSVLAGLGTIAMAGLLLRRRGRLEAGIAVLCTSTSYLLIHYSSEARGYSYAVFFALLGLYAVTGYVKRPSARLLVLFWVAVLLGALSHLGFLQFYVAAGLWSVWRLYRTRAEHGGACDRLLLLHAVPVVGLALLYRFDVRRVSGGGGPSYDLAAVVIETASYTLGGPPRGAGAIAAALLLLVLSCAGLLAWRRRGLHLGLFFVLGSFAVPGALAATKPVVLFPRYFLIASVFLLLLLAPLVADLLRAGGMRRWAAAILLAGFVLGNAWHTAALLRDGRGRYLEALRYIEAASSEEIITLGSDSDFRNGKLIRFYQRQLDQPRRLRYISREELDETAPEWRLLHRFAVSEPLDEIVHDEAGNRYHWAKTFPYSALSGWHWLLYRRDQS